MKSRLTKLNLKRRQFLQLGLMGTAFSILASCTASSAKTQGQKIIIIGAGIAGLAAARTLHNKGFQVTVVEGRNRLGGRLFTDRTLGVPVDLGASWIHGHEDNPITELVQEFNLKTAVTDYDNLTLYVDGDEVPNEEIKQGQKAYEQLQEEAKDRGENLSRDISVFQAIKPILDDEGLDDRQLQIVQWWLTSEVETEYGMDLKELSLWEWDEDEAFDGDEWLLPGGYSQLAEKMAEGLNISLDRPVTRITQANKTLTVSTSQGDIEGDAVIVTLPLGVLKAGTVEFNPPLPQPKLKAIDRLAMGLLNKVVLRFPDVFWDDTEIIGAISKVNTDFEFFVNLATYTQQPLLMGISGGSFARRVEGLSQNQAVEELTKGLRRIYGANIPNPEGVVRSQWLNDPFSFGSYSGLPVGVEAKEREILGKSVGDRLFFAGEATSLDYPGTVHGAFLSGLQAAKEIEKRFKE